ncbi:MAG: EthD family reductase [Burkholderiales bacterium]
MSVSYFVRYDVEPADREAFIAHYREHHVPILARWPGMKRVVLHTPLDWSDAFPVNRGRAVLLAQLEFDSREAMEQAFRSPERAEAREDFKRFPAFTGTVTHQAMSSSEAWRRPA